MLERNLTPYEAGYLYTLGHIAATRTDLALLYPPHATFIAGEHFATATLRDEYSEAAKKVNATNPEKSSRTYVEGVTAAKTHLKNLLEAINESEEDSRPERYPGCRSAIECAIKDIEKFDGVPVHKMTVGGLVRLTGRGAPLFRAIWESANRYCTEQTNQ